MSLEVKKIIQELIVPELQEIKAQQRTTAIEIKRLDEKIDNLHQQFVSEIKDLDAKMDSINEKVEDVKEEIRNLRDEFRITITLHERIASLEAKVGHLHS